MSHVAKIIEVVGSSDKSWEEAAQAAVKMASETVSGIQGVRVKSMTATVKDNEIAMYKTTVKISFGVEH